MRIKVTVLFDSNSFGIEFLPTPNVQVETWSASVVKAELERRWNAFEPGGEVEEQHRIIVKLAQVTNELVDEVRKYLETMK